MSPHAEVLDQEEVQSGQLVPIGQAFELTEHGLSANSRDPSFQECEAAAHKLKKVHDGLSYWLGDLIVMTEGLFHEEASQIIDQAFLSAKDVSAFRFVAERVAPKVRSMAPSWQHAQAVAALKPAEQERWIQKALDEEWIASKLKAEVQADEAGGASKMRFLLIVDCGTEAKQEVLSDRLEREGFNTTKRSGVKKEKAPKEKKAKAPKKQPPVRKRRGSVRPYKRKKSSK